MDNKTEIRKASFYEREFFLGRDCPAFRSAVINALNFSKKNDCQDKLKSFLTDNSGENKAFLFNSVEESYNFAICSAKQFTASAKLEEKKEVLFLSKDLYDFYVNEVNDLNGNVKLAAVNHLGNFIAALSEKTCAVVAELFNSYGEQLFDKDLIVQMAEICSVRDIVFIVDERNTFPAFTGKPFAFMNYGIIPDIVIAGGLFYRSFSLGAVLFSKKVKPAVYKKETGAVALAGVYALCLTSSEFLSGVKNLENALKSALSVCKKVKAFSVNGVLGSASVDDAKSFAAELKESGLKVGVSEDGLLFSLPLSISEEELAFGIRVLKNTLGGAKNPFDIG